MSVVFFVSGKINQTSELRTKPYGTHKRIGKTRETVGGGRGGDKR